MEHELAQVNKEWNDNISKGTYIYIWFWLTLIFAQNFSKYVIVSSEANTERGHAMNKMEDDLGKANKEWNDNMPKGTYVFEFWLIFIFAQNFPK